MNNKGQYAVFVVAIAILGMFLLYINLVNPIERWSLLYGNGSETGGETDGGGVSPQTFYTTTVGLIGGASGQQIGTDHSILGISVSHPLASASLYSAESLRLDSNIFISGSHNITANDIDNLTTSGLEFTFTLSSRVGAPKVRVLLNNEVIYEAELNAGNYGLVEIPVSELASDNTLTLQCAYQGFAFWTLQSCTFSNVNLNRVYYDQTDMAQYETLHLTDDEVSAPIMYVSMWVESSNTDGPLVIWLNDDKIYESAPTVGNDSFEVRNPNLAESSIITFQSSEGSAYDITKVQISFRSEVEPKEKKVINLPDNVAQQIRASGKDVRFVLTVTDVDIPGKVYFFLRPSAYVYPVSVAEGTIFAVVENEEINPASNTITISSPDAKFTASQFKIIEHS